MSLPPPASPEPICATATARTSAIHSALVATGFSPPPLQPVIGISAAQVIDAALARRAAARRLEVAAVA